MCKNYIRIISQTLIILVKNTEISELKKALSSINLALFLSAQGRKGC